MNRMKQILGVASWQSPPTAVKGSKSQARLTAQQGKPVGRADRRDPCPHVLLRRELIEHDGRQVVRTSEVACTRKASHQGKTDHRNTDGTEWA